MSPLQSVHVTFKQEGIWDDAFCLNANLKRDEGELTELRSYVVHNYVSYFLKIYSPIAD